MSITGIRDGSDVHVMDQRSQLINLGPLESVVTTYVF